RVMTRHLELMAQIFGEEHGCRMFRKIGPWYAKRFGPANVFNHRIVKLTTVAEYHAILNDYRRWRSQFVDELGQLKPNYRPTPMVASFMQEPGAAARNHIPVPKGPVEVW